MTTQCLVLSYATGSLAALVFISLLLAYSNSKRIPSPDIAPLGWILLLAFWPLFLGYVGIIFVSERLEQKRKERFK
jgi:Co/Zn/Cd efflux system component